MRSGWATRRSLTFAPKRVDGGQAGRKVRGGVAWVCCNSEQVGAGSGGPALELAREEQVGELRLDMGEPPRVPHFSQSSKRILAARCTMEDTVTTREACARRRSGSSRPVSAKWPRWFVPNCISKPCLVCWWGMAITPALSSIARASGARVLLIQPGNLDPTAARTLKILP